MVTVPEAYIEIIDVRPLDRFKMGWNDRVINIRHAEHRLLITILRRPG